MGIASEIATVVTAIGGFELIKWVVMWIATRKSTQKKESEEAEALQIINEQSRVDWLEKRICERDAKIDSLYIELRTEQQNRLEEIFKRHEVELKFKESEVKKCDVRKCPNRKPPSDY